MKSIYLVLYATIIISITYFVHKRIKAKGCFTFGYIGLCIFVIGILTFVSWAFMYNSFKDAYNSAISGTNYQAKVISYTTKKEHSSEKGTYYMYTPIVTFTTKDGDVIKKELDFSKSDVKVGDTYLVNYNNGKVITLGFSLIISMVGPFIFSFIFTFLFIGILIFGLGYNMENYYSIASKVGFYFFLPFLMIGFDALLVYGLFYGNSTPIAVKVLLIIFILILTIGIFAYIKTIAKKGAPKMKRISNTSWVSDW